MTLDQKWDPRLHTQFYNWGSNTCSFNGFLWSSYSKNGKMEFGCFWKIHSYPVIQAIVSIYIRLQFHCILPLGLTLSISAGVVCWYMYLRTQSRSILLLLHKVVSHYCSSEEFYCSLVCIVTTIRQYRSFPLAFSPKILFFMHEWFLQNTSPYSILILHLILSCRPPSF